MPARVISGQKGKVNKGEKSSLINDASTILSKPTFSQSSGSDKQAFYTGSERQNLQGSQVQRVRELQEENDHLQREITAKESEVANSTDPLVILADIEHRKVVISRNTGEVMKIYQRNEERLQRIEDLKAQNTQLQLELTEMQGQFITSTQSTERTDFATRFFMVKSQIEKNLNEIEELSKQ